MKILLIALTIFCSMPNAFAYNGVGIHAQSGAPLNVNRNVNVTRNVNVVGGGWHGYYPTGAAVITTAAIGSIVHSIPPSCTTTVVNGITYSQCGPTWYQPQYAGSSVQYVVVNPPK